MRAQTEVRRGETFLMMKVNKSFVLWSWGGSWRDTDNCAYCVPRCIVNVNSNSNVMLTFIGLKSPRTVLRGGEGFLYAFVLFFSVRATTGTSTALYLVNYIYIYIERERKILSVYVVGGQGLRIFIDIYVVGFIVNNAGLLPLSCSVSCEFHSHGPSPIILYQPFPLNVI